MSSRATFVTPESTSAAVRFALSAGRPVLTTGGGIFGDVADATYPIASCEPGAIAAAIETVLADPALAAHLAQQAERRARSTSWDRVAEEYSDLLDRL